MIVFSTPAVKESPLLDILKHYTLNPSLNQSLNDLIIHGTVSIVQTNEQFSQTEVSKAAISTNI